MPKRLYIAALAASILVLAGASPVGAHSVSLTATGVQRAWVSPQRFSDERPLTVSVWVGGRELQARAEGGCRATLFSRRLALEVNACARTVGGKVGSRSAVAIRYIGSTRFTLRYWAS